MAISKGTLWFAKASLMAIAIYLGSTSLIHYALLPRTQSTERRAPEKIKQPPADEARFRSLLEAGNEAVRAGLYATALDNFLEAQRSLDPLTDEQYNALKEARLQVAKAYEYSGNGPAESSVYRSMADCAIRDGNTLLRAKSFEDALARGRDAAQFSEQLSEGRRDSLFASTSLLVSSLGALHRYSDAADAEQHFIDFLRESSDPRHDPAIIQAYMMLEGIYSDAKDWHGTEQALLQVLDACDAMDPAVASPTATKGWAQYNLVIAYYLEGDTNQALSRAEDFYSEQSRNQQDIRHPVWALHNADDFAELALQIAIEAKRPDDIDLWHRRGALGPNGGIKIIALHPPGAH